MLNQTIFSPQKQKLIVYITLVIVTLAVYWQVNHYDFINLDDNIYVTENINIQSGITPDAIRWAFSTTYAEFWHPLTWLSLMFDYHFYGLNAGGYHVTNLILHILSTLLLFWLFNRMTQALWPSAFVAAVFALHPLHVESVAWISERKDVLSAFFWMLTLCLYIFYTEKPVIKRYLLVVFGFVLALMSKPMVVTLPAIMILLDYWPLKRFESQKNNLVLWQLKEKLPFIVLSVVFSIITIYAQPKLPIEGWPFPLGSRITNALVSFVIYLEKIFRPHDLSICYPFFGQASLWQISGAALLILAISVAVIMTIKRRPYLFVGWLWYLITLLPVIGIIPVGNNAMADRYIYLPSIGIAIILAWEIPLLFRNADIRKKILFPAGIAVLAILSFLTWRQCGYWKNSFELFSNASRVTKDNALVHINLGIALTEEEKFNEAVDHYNKAISMIPSTPDNILAYNKIGIAYNKLSQLVHINLGLALVNEGKFNEAIDHYNKAIGMTPITPDHILAFNNRGLAYNKLGQNQRALEDFNKAINLDRYDMRAYKNRGVTYAKLGLYQSALEDFNEAIRLKPNYADTYINRGVTYAKLDQYQRALEDFNKATRLKPNYADPYYNRGVAYIDLRQYQSALEDFNEAIRLKPDYADAYSNRGGIYLNQGYKDLGCHDAQKACQLGNCEVLESAQRAGYCR